MVNNDEASSWTIRKRNDTILQEIEEGRNKSIMKKNVELIYKGITHFHLHFGGKINGKTVERKIQTTRYLSDILHRVCFLPTPEELGA